jgi:energy-coupling factor transporter ATP-binding protein EcfA2
MLGQKLRGNTISNQPTGLGMRAKAYADRLHELLQEKGLHEHRAYGGLVRRATRLRDLRRGPRHLSYLVRLADPLQRKAALRLSPDFAYAIGAPHVIGRVSPGDPGDITYQVELPTRFWQFYTRDDVTGLGIGVAESGQQMEITFDPPNVLVAGMPGSGKSTLLQSIIHALCHTYTPDQMQMVIISPHKKDHVEGFEREVHQVFECAANTPEEIRRALIYAGQTLLKRQRGEQPNQPLLVVVVDEADQVLALHQGYLTLLEMIARGGRKDNVQLVLATQRPRVGHMEDAIRLAGHRYVGTVANKADAVVATGRGETGAEMLAYRGDFIHLAAGNPLIERFQAAQPTARDVDSLERKDSFADLELNDADFESLFGLAAPGKAGRPETQLDMATLAWYVAEGVAGDGFESISRNVAHAHGYTRSVHDLHKSRAIALVSELRRLLDASGWGAILDLSEVDL